MRAPFLGAAVALLSSAAAGHAADWPQWRGPGMLGISSERGLPVRWGPDRNIAWKADVAGLGASSPIAWGDLSIVTSQVGEGPVRGGGAHPLLARDDRDLSTRESAIGGRRPSPDLSGHKIVLVVEAFRRTDGRRVWEYRFEAAGDLPENHEKHNLATPTPVTDGERVYAWFGNGQVLALDMQGQLRWKRHLAEDHGHANAASYVPSIVQYDGLLYMTNEVGVVTCADIRTGERVFRHRLQGVFFASPVAADGKVYMLSETGETFVLKAGRTPEILAINTLPGRFIASPAISRGRLLLRSDRSLYSIAEASPDI